MAVSLLSFDLCNNKLLARDIFIDISEYISLTHMIPLNLPIQHRLFEVSGLICFMIDIINIDPHEYAISINSLERIGFVIKDTFQNRIRRLCNQPRDNLENELGFLKKNGLKLGIDFDIDRIHISTTGDDLDIEYKITTLAFYKLVIRKYSRSFLAILNMRVFQIISNYHIYVKQYYESKVNSLDKTIHGLMHDLTRLTTDHPNIKKNIIFQNNSNSFESGSFRDSYISEASIELNDNSSPISVMMESPRLSAQMIDLHKKVMNIISSPHESLDVLHPNFITNDRDSIYVSRNSIPSSMLGESFGTNNQDDLPIHVDVLQDRFCSILNNGSNNFRETMPIYLIPDPYQINRVTRKNRHSAHQ